MRRSPCKYKRVMRLWEDRQTNPEVQLLIPTPQCLEPHCRPTDWSGLRGPCCICHRHRSCGCGPYSWRPPLRTHGSCSEMQKASLRSETLRAILSGGKSDFITSKALHLLYGIDRFLSFGNTRIKSKNKPSWIICSCVRLGGFHIASELLS